MKPFAEQNVLVVGPGALGTYFSARLAQKVSRLWVLDHRVSRSAELQESGLHVGGTSLLDWIPPDGRIAASPAGWPKMDVIFLMVKAPALPAAVKAAKKAASPSAILVCLQNGWGVEKSLKAAWPPRRVVWGITREAVTWQVPGKVFHAASGTTLLDAKSPAAKEVFALLSAAGFNVRLEKNFENERWTKLIVNACINPLSALADVTNGRLKEPPLAPLVEQVLRECLQLSRAAGRRISEKEVREAVGEVIQTTGANRNSLGQDLSRGRMTERAFLLGPFLEIARRHQTPAPTLSFLNELLDRVEKIAK